MCQMSPCSPPSFSNFHHLVCHDDDGDEEAGRGGAQHHPRGLNGCWEGDVVNVSGLYMRYEDCYRYPDMKPIN